MDGSIDETDAPPRLIANRYRVAEVLGVGGMSVVHDGFDERLQRPVAVKCLKGDLLRKEGVRSRFETEARWAARLSHPHAVAVYDTGEQDGVPFLVMERLPGETLGDRIAAGPLDAGWLRRIAVEVLGALGAAHDCGIVHRDVKPGNILLTSSGHAKVADFGIAKSLGLDSDQMDLTRTGQLVGTPSYLAPERLEGTAASARSDLYSLGVVLYEALTGRKPYTGSDPLAVAYAIRHEDPVPLAELRPDADPTFVAAVERAMEKEPDARWTSAAEMADALREAPTIVTSVPATVAGGDGTMVLTRPPATPAPVAAGRRRGAPVWWLVPLALLLVVAAAVALAGRTGDGGGGGAGGGDSTLAEELQAVAARVEVGDGPRGPEVAARLRTIAESVSAGDDAGEAATSLYADVVAWNDQRLFLDSATELTTEVLAKVPGVEAAQAPPEPAAVEIELPVPDEGDDEGRGKGKGRGKGDD